MSRISLICAAVLAIPACTLPMMPVKDNLAPEVPFSHGFIDRGALAFGGFHVVGFHSDTGGEVTHGGDVLPEFMRHLSTATGYDDYGFQLEPGARRVRCTAEMSRTTVHDGPLRVSSTSQALRCAIWLTPDGDYARLELGDGGGTLTAGGRSFVIENRNIAGRKDRLDDAGYGIIEGGRDVAVVQRANGGAVWITRDANEVDQGLYAATAAALLLYQPPN